MTATHEVLLSFRHHLRLREPVRFSGKPKPAGGLKWGVDPEGGRGESQNVVYRVAIGVAVSVT